MTESLHYSVDPQSEIPVYQQIENLVVFAIASGAYSAKDTLPSVREMAAATGVNANTVTKAYRDLELMGLVVTRRGVGVHVAPDIAATCRESAKRMVRRHLRMAAGEGLASGITEKEIKAIVQEALKDRALPYESHED